MEFWRIPWKEEPDELQSVGSQSQTQLSDFHLFFFLVFIYLFFKFYFIFKLYITVLVLPNIKMNPPQVYMCSPS